MARPRETKMTTNSSSMPIPEWAKNAGDQLARAHQAIDYGKADAKIRDLTLIDAFTSHFAEYEVKNNDVLVHLFPRRGDGDRWYPASCDKHGAYRPARREIRVEGCLFPQDMGGKTKLAADNVWQGNVAIDEVPELNAYVVQFQNAKTTAQTVGVSKFVDKFCEEVDKQLDVS